MDRYLLQNFNQHPENKICLITTCCGTVTLLKKTSLQMFSCELLKKTYEQLLLTLHEKYPNRDHKKLRIQTLVTQCEQYIFQRCIHIPVKPLSASIALIHKPVN